MGIARLANCQIRGMHWPQPRTWDVCDVELLPGPHVQEERASLRAQQLARLRRADSCQGIE
jgi:hypothetical protein